MKRGARCLTARLTCSLLVALFWLSNPSHRQGPGVPIFSLAPSPVKILSSRLPVARMCSSYTRLRDRLKVQHERLEKRREKEGWKSFTKARVRMWRWRTTVEDSRHSQTVSKVHGIQKAGQTVLFSSENLCETGRDGSLQNKWRHPLVGKREEFGWHGRPDYILGWWNVSVDNFMICCLFFNEYALWKMNGSGLVPGLSGASSGYRRYSDSRLENYIYLLYTVYASHWSECAETLQVSGKMDKVLMTHLPSPLNIGRKTWMTDAWPLTVPAIDQWPWWG